MPDPQFTDDAPQAGSAAATNVRVRIDERNLVTQYANAFRPNATAGELALDFGINLPQPNPQRQQDAQQNPPQAEMNLQLHSRMVLSYQTAKRLAIALGQIVQRYEQQYGELALTRTANAQTQDNGDTQGATEHA